MRGRINNRDNPMRKSSRRRNTYYESRHEINKRKKRGRILSLIITFLILLILGVGIVLICKSCSSSSIIGSWNYDSVTIYNFEENETGSLDLPNASYEFSYQIDREKLRIDFLDNQAIDQVYTYKVEGNELTLINDEDIARTYVMKKENKK